MTQQLTAQGFAGNVKGTQPQPGPATMRTASGRLVPVQSNFGSAPEVQRRFLVVLPYWEGDKESAEELALLIADMERVRAKGVDLMVMQRFDAIEFSKPVLSAVAMKFDKVHIHVCRRRDGTSYPFASGQMFFDLVTLVGQGAEWLRQYYGFLWLEPDCVPTRPGWMQEIAAAFQLADQQGKAALGFIHDDPIRHMNGVAVYAIDIWRKVPNGRFSGGRPGTAFDIDKATDLLPLAMDSSLFHFEYRLATISPTELFQPRRNGVTPALFHGVKDKSARSAVRARYLGGNRESTQARPPIFTFFNPVPGFSNEENQSILALWAEAWRGRGFNPIILKQVDAVKHKDFAAFSDAVMRLPCFIHKEVQKNRLFRWLALDAMGGGFYCDYDVLPNRIGADTIARLSGFHVTRPREGTPAIALAYIDKPALARWLDRIQNYQPRDPEDKVEERMNVTDLNVLHSCVREDGVVPESWVLNAGEPGWSEAGAVHFTSKAIMASVDRGRKKSELMERFLRSPIVKTEPEAPARPSTPAVLSVEERKETPAVVPAEQCPECGFPMATIRGRHPGDEKRKVCPQCLQELMEDMAAPAPAQQESAEASASPVAAEPVGAPVAVPVKRRPGRPPKR